MVLPPRLACDVRKLLVIVCICLSILDVFNIVFPNILF